MSLTPDVLGPYPGPFEQHMAATRFETDMSAPQTEGDADPRVTSPPTVVPLRPERPRPPIRPDLLPVWPVELVWRCESCGYLRQSTHRPDFCPACGAGPGRLVGRTSIEWRRIFRQEMLAQDTKGG